MVLDLLLIGLGITLEPFPLTVFILMLSAEKGTRKGLAFILGWLACLVAVIAAVLLTTGGQPPEPSTAPSTAALAVKLALGVALILYRRAPVAPEGPPPQAAGLDGRLDRLSLWAAAGLAAFLQPWTLVAAGAATVTQAKLSTAGRLPDAGAVLPAGDRPASCTWSCTPPFAPAAAGARLRAAADLAGHAPRPGHHPDLPAAGLLAGRQEHLPAGQLSWQVTPAGRRDPFRAQRRWRPGGRHGACVRAVHGYQAPAFWRFSLVSGGAARPCCHGRSVVATAAAVGGAGGPGS